MDTLGKRIRFIRKKIGLSQEELATRLGLESKMAVSRYESDENEPDVTKLVTLSRLGGVNPGWLLTGDAPTAPVLMAHEAPAPYESESESFVYVPRYEVQASAGHGEIIHSEQIVDYLAFKSEWVKRDLGLDPKHLVLIHAVGDSMEPTIHAGDLLLLDRSVDRVKDDSLYVLAVDDALLVKRVQKLLNGEIRVKSDNPAYQEQILMRDETQQLRIIGRLIWIGRRF